jgi:hypothetical protein
MKNTVRINFEFPREHYPYLKLLCAKKGQSLRDFASDLLIREIEEYEDRQLAKKADVRLSEMKDSDLINFDDAAKLAGWNDAE